MIWHWVDIGLLSYALAIALSWLVRAFTDRPVFTLSFIWGKPRLDEKGVLTHLQKFSPFFVMLTFPFGFHVGFMPMRQHYTVNDQTGAITWFPGTEFGPYFRLPGFREDIELGMKWTWGYFGFHLD